MVVAQSWFHHLWPLGRGYALLTEASKALARAWEIAVAKVSI